MWKASSSNRGKWWSNCVRKTVAVLVCIPNLWKAKTISNSLPLHPVHIYIYIYWNSVRAFLLVGFVLWVFLIDVRISFRRNKHGVSHTSAISAQLKRGPQGSYVSREGSALPPLSRVRRGWRRNKSAPAWPLREVQHGHSGNEWGSLWARPFCLSDSPGCSANTEKGVRGGGRERNERVNYSSVPFGIRKNKKI